MARQKTAAQVVVYYPDLRDPSCKWDLRPESVTIVAVGNRTLVHTMGAGMIAELRKLYARCASPLNIKLDSRARWLCISQDICDPSPAKVDGYTTSLRTALQRLGISVHATSATVGEIEKKRKNPLAK